MNTALLILFVMLVAIKAGFSLVHIIATSAPDFAYYYEAAQEVIRPGTQAIHLLPPFSVLLYAPLAYLPFNLAQGIWVGASFVLLFAIVWWAGRLVGIKKAQTLLFIVALSFVSFPTRFTLGMGQVNLIALALVVGALVVEQKKHTRLAGVLLGLSWLIKPELALLFPLVLFYRRWQLLLAVLLTVGAATAASLFLWGTQAYNTYYTRLLPLLDGVKEAGIYYNQSFLGGLVRAGMESPWVYGLGVLLIFFITLYSLLKKKETFLQGVWRYMPVLILIEPIAWQHHLVFLIPTYMWLWARHLSLSRRLTLAASYVLVSWNFANSSFLDTMPLGWLVALHGTIGVVILWLLTL
jgi:hypothetical protein